MRTLKCVAHLNVSPLDEHILKFVIHHSPHVVEAKESSIVYAIYITFTMNAIEVISELKRLGTTM